MQGTTAGLQAKTDFIQAMPSGIERDILQARLPLQSSLRSWFGRGLHKLTVTSRRVRAEDVIRSASMPAQSSGKVQRSRGRLNHRCYPVCVITGPWRYRQRERRCPVCSLFRNARRHTFPKRPMWTPGPTLPLRSKLRLRLLSNSTSLLLQLPPASITPQQEHPTLETSYVSQRSHKTHESLGQLEALGRRVRRCEGLSNVFGLFAAKTVVVFCKSRKE